MTDQKIGAVMVAGGGIGGVQASLDLAEAGFKVYLVDESPGIGGVMAQLDKTFPTNDCSACMFSPKLVTVGQNPNIDVLAYSSIEGISGGPGNFVVKVRKKSRTSMSKSVRTAVIAPMSALFPFPTISTEG